MSMNDNNREIATLAGGCFWCLEAVYEQLQGVDLVESGYTGGHVPSPSYEQVCGGRTGHAEAVRITFDPSIISYKDLLKIFFVIHDPTTMNSQGPDVGPQYRSAIFIHTPEQQTITEEVIAEMQAAHIWDQPFVTEIAPETEFFVAEDYHQQYYRTNAYQPYCQVIIAPKVAKFRKEYMDRLKPEAASAIYY
jgi:peptide-methionine (S)-S-oxide reductase